MEQILGGLLIAIVAGLVGKNIGMSNTVKRINCVERQQACQALLFSKISNIEEKLDDLTTVVRTLTKIV